MVIYPMVIYHIHRCPFPIGWLMIDGIPNRPFYFYQKDSIGHILFFSINIPRFDEQRRAKTTLSTLSTLSPEPNLGAAPTPSRQGFRTAPEPWCGQGKMMEIWRKYDGNMMENDGWNSKNHGKNHGLKWEWCDFAENLRSKNSGEKQLAKMGIGYIIGSFFMWIFCYENWWTIGIKQWKWNNQGGHPWDFEVSLWL